jgi:uncharacterized protein (DUF302 family)
VSYFFSKTLPLSLELAEPLVRDALKAEGFGVLTEIDIRQTLKNKLDVDFRPYKILGACNPPLAYKALQSESHIGLMLPCNVILQETAGTTEVSAVDPVASMVAVQNDGLGDVATEVRSRLERVITGL